MATERTQQLKIQTVMEALADPTRREILNLLKRGSLSVGEIAEHFDISGASLSHHLTKLKNAELVFTKREGQHIRYALQSSVFEDIASSLADFFSIGKNKR